ncbi:hypothetical protein ACUY3K_06045 [Corynebacterium uberis]|uniref:hypothetical protein n=1 Tax=Corynebacterium TaxID=1716 RepID=UPI001D0B1703|nr:MULTISPECIES: hypothetical protein [Corynebacterium]MCZ9308254.1 hypothetical protein [Corynebacterium sp. c6VSa_13]UDL73934.1 hypothetical protein LH391_01515 [Corynebacterium uberis]UDL75183.1 hypothetical protein LH393_07900 [Corynebacterium uberis]UDL77394.1 hypothetical protein LH394_07880 [Corynebacterium uberis]UDL79679.1 hypothetical protein LH392_08305 [Corynebacterium uberis]
MSSRRFSDAQLSDRPDPRDQLRSSNLGSEGLAATILPVLAELYEDVDNTKALVVGTGDGLHVCSIGLDSAETGAQLAALNSSLAGVSGAQAQMLGHAHEEGAETIVAMTLPSDVLVVCTVPYPDLNNLLLAVSVTDSQLGMVIHLTRKAAQKISALLKVEEPDWDDESRGRHYR